MAYTAFNTWKIGEKGKDNGVLILIATTDRKVRIETGKGVGGDLTDLQSSEIIRTNIGPLLKEGRLRDAIESGAGAIASALTPGGVVPNRGPPPPPTISPRTVGLGAGGIAIVILLLIVSPGFRSIFFYMLQFAFIFGGRGGGRRGGGGGSGYSGGGGSSGGGGASGGY